MKKLLLSVLVVALVGTLVTSPSQMKAAFSDVVEVPENTTSAGVRSRPFVELFSPHGGETWYVGEEQIIQWRAVDPDGLKLRVTILVSPDGDQWFPVAKRKKNTGFYRWTPDISPGKYLLKIQVVAPKDPWQVVGEDVSDGFWKLKVRPPTLTPVP